MNNHAPAPLRMACNRPAADAKREDGSTAPALSSARRAMAEHTPQSIKSPSVGRRKEVSRPSGFILRVSN